MTANHAPGCPAIADVRDGCSCLLRGVAAQEGHDPLCDPKSRVVLHDRRICDCNFIARVRADERERIKRGVNLIESVEWALNPEAAVLAVIDSEEASDE